MPLDAFDALMRKPAPERGSAAAEGCGTEIQRREDTTMPPTMRAKGGAVVQARRVTQKGGRHQLRQTAA